MAKKKRVISAEMTRYYAMSDKAHPWGGIGIARNYREE